MEIPNCGTVSKWDLKEPWATTTDDNNRTGKIHGTSSRMNSREVLSVALGMSSPTSSSGINNNSSSINNNRNSSSNDGFVLYDGENGGRHRVRKPGSYIVMSECHGDPNFFHLPVPADVVPGNVFDFTITTTINGGRHVVPRRLSVRCPPDARPGCDTLQIAVLQEPRTVFRGPLKVAHLTQSTSFVSSDSKKNKNRSSSGQNDDDDDDGDDDEGMVTSSQKMSSSRNGGSVTMTPDIVKRNEATIEASAEAILVKIPHSVKPGGQFIARRKDGSKFLVTTPLDGRPGQTLRIVLSTVEEDQNNNNEKEVLECCTKKVRNSGFETSKQREKDSFAQNRPSLGRYKIFEIVAPKGVQPNQILPINVLGKRIPLQLPDNVIEGQTIKLKVPVDEVVDNIELDWDKFFPGWNRTIRMNDFKFKWVKIISSQERQENRIMAMDEKEESATTLTDVDIFKDLAFVRHLMFLEGNDARMRTGTVTLIPAEDAVVESELTIGGFKTLVSYADVAHFQTQPFEVKTNWFQQICSELSSPWESGRIQIVVRRQNLLAHSVRAVMSLSRSDMRKKWRCSFQDEPGVDAGGVMREWFQLVTEQLFNPDFGLWLSSANNQICMRINPACHVACPEDHSIYFRFLGRMMGRALFDRQLVKGHMVRYLYKHLLGWPISFDDLESLDEEYYQSLKKISTLDDVEGLCLDFTTTEEILGEIQTIELIRRGSQQEVDKENRLQYLEAILRYHMLERNKFQIQELLLGFFDVVPEQVLTVFDPSELELLMCGLPTLDMDDWQSNTIFTGNLRQAENVHIVEWFWDVLKNQFDQEMQARLLQFATGTSGVPQGGFSVLQGNDGNIKLFTIHGVDHTQYAYPRAHTCFNRIDLPNYKSKEELYEKLKLAVAVAGVGFDIE